MKFVTLTTDMRPWRMNDRVPLPDALADKLVASGEAKDAQPFHEANENPGGEVNPQRRTPVQAAVAKVRETLRLPRPTTKVRGVT